MAADLRAKMQAAHDKISATNIRADAVLTMLDPQLAKVNAAFDEIAAMGADVEGFVAEIAEGLPPVAGVPLGDALVKSLGAFDPAASSLNAGQDVAPASPDAVAPPQAAEAAPAPALVEAPPVPMQAIPRT